MQRRPFLASGLAAASTIALPAWAQSYPSRTIRYICPWPAGGATDQVMRVLAESASRLMGQSVVI